MMGNVLVFALVMVQWISQASTHPYIDGLKGVLRNDTEGLMAGIDTVDEKIDGVESIPYTIISSSNIYEKRLYPPVTMACSDMVYNITEEDGGEETDEKMSSMMNMYRRMTTQLLKKPSRLLFMKLFRYISGLNKGVEEIPMTSPVLSLVMPLAKRRIHKQMCFYLGKKFSTVEPPKPRNNEVQIITKDKFVVYVHTFGGYALKDANWIEESEKFKVWLGEEKGEDLNEIDFSKFLIAGYDSPMKFWNRRNEVLFTVRNVPDIFTDNTENDQDAFNDEQSESVKSEGVFVTLNPHKDEIFRNITDEEEIVKTKSHSAHNSFESEEVEKQKSDSEVDHHRALNVTENDIGEENIQDNNHIDGNYFQTTENSTYNSNVTNKLNIFQADIINQSETVIDTKGLDANGDQGIDDGLSENKVEQQTTVEPTQKQQNNVTIS